MGKMVGVVYQTRNGMGFQTHGRVQDMGGFQSCGRIPDTGGVLNRDGGVPDR